MALECTSWSHWPQPSCQNSSECYLVAEYCSEALPEHLDPVAVIGSPDTNTRRPCRHLVVEMTGSSKIPHLGEFLRPLVQFEELDTIEIWANSIESFAGLWGVGVGGVFLPKLRHLKLRANACSFQSPRSVFAANPLDKVVDAFAGASPRFLPHQRPCTANSSACWNSSFPLLRSPEVSWARHGGVVLAGLVLNRLELHDIGLPPGASASGIKQLVLTNPRWEDLRIAMSAKFSPDLKVSLLPAEALAASGGLRRECALSARPLLQVIRVCGSSARAMRTRMMANMLETPSLEAGWRIGSPSSESAMHKVRSFVVLHDLEEAKQV